MWCQVVSLIDDFRTVGGGMTWMHKSLPCDGHVCGFVIHNCFEIKVRLIDWCFSQREFLHGDFVISN